MIDNTLFSLAQEVQRLFIAKNLTLATAESCTGGLLGAVITAVPGSSQYYFGGAVVYANEAKEILTDVDKDLLLKKGAVSPEVAQGLALGIKNKLKTTVGVGITGIAGPSGGTPDKPVGLVYIGIANVQDVKAFKYQFNGDRQEIRTQTVKEALKLLIQNCFDN
ncbi:CinA family protein [Carboxydothermus hydrogenoformans]|uniref:Competence/damage-inducible family protein n=1 Tax=Carboxydothermus hydrogenoformans (strain ATCC BAA-161 / DSM 6008 / Z-2901) TaxID=246194 RepID=Q3ACX4_CARHZ|nr:CinA family protein [Carboxydothermus hydrogenoformans]ABB15122.1 competence/damage-inducible family protein [Carboxydothermus hydrogenoformans Z-2901]